MKAREARDLGHRIAAKVDGGDIESAYSLLVPLLATKTAFPTLDLIGGIIGTAPLKAVSDFHRRICEDGTMGGWVLIGSGLGQQLDSDLAGALNRCRTYIIASDAWYGADILGERVPGPALVMDLDRSLERMDHWRRDVNAWVRRAVGVAVHFWAKRSNGAEALLPQAKKLTDFLDPMFSERDTPAIKGVGWGLKTLGKHYPDLVLNWLEEIIIPSGREYRALMLRKTMTYLTDAQRARIHSLSREAADSATG